MNANWTYLYPFLNFSQQNLIYFTAYELQILQNYIPRNFGYRF